MSKPAEQPGQRLSWFRAIAPGILLAATGVGAGDLVTGTLAGVNVGVGVLWAVVVGTVLKFVLSEGIARWQLATGTTLIEGWHQKLGGWVRWVFLIYLAMFTVIVGRALVSACGIAGTGLYPIGDPEQSVVVWAVIHSLVGVVFVLRGSFKAFETIMATLIGLMFVTVVGTAVLVSPPIGEVLAGFVPAMPESGPKWVVAVLGGVGGTVTLLSYGYWIAEQDRRGAAMLPVCRTDLAVGNGMTGLFGLSVVIIGSQLELDGSGARLALQMADKLAIAVGEPGRWVFLFGFWGAVFSSLLGVWQGIPYLFADFVRLEAGDEKELRFTTPYRAWLFLVAIVPLFLLNAPLEQIQLLYGVFGACFLPLLALTLLIMNGRAAWVGERFKNPAWATLLLLAALLFFAYLGFA